MNHFARLELEVSFDIDQDALKSAWLNAQGTQDPLLNEAFTILEDPATRALYLLELKGHSVADKTLYDLDFLDDMMTLRMRLEAQDETVQSDIQAYKIRLVHAFAQAWKVQDMDACQRLGQKLNFIKHLLKDAKKPQHLEDNWLI